MRGSGKSLAGAATSFPLADRPCEFAGVHELIGHAPRAQMEISQTRSAGS